MTHICVGVDVSKSKSTVSAYGWGDILLMNAYGVAIRLSNLLRRIQMKPRDVSHTSAALKELAESIMKLGGEVRVVMEHKGRHWFPIAKVLYVAGLFFSAVYPNLISSFSDNKLRNIKNDKSDSRKLARYGLKY